MGVVTIVKTTIIFKVAGEAERGAEIVGFDYSRISQTQEEIIVLVKNTGSVTESIKLPPFL